MFSELYEMTVVSLAFHAACSAIFFQKKKKRKDSGPMNSGAPTHQTVSVICSGIIDCNCSSPVLMTLGVVRGQNWCAFLCPTSFASCAFPHSVSTVVLHRLASTRANSSVVTLYVSLNLWPQRLRLFSWHLLPDLSQRCNQNQQAGIVSSSTIRCQWCLSGLFATTQISHHDRYGQCVSMHALLSFVVAS